MGVNQKKREAEEADKVEVAPGVTVASLRCFRAALNRPSQGLPKRHRLYAFGCMVAIRGGYRMARR